MHPKHHAHNASKEERLHRVIGKKNVEHEIREAVTEGVHEHEGKMHRGKVKTKLRFANGGMVPGHKGKHRGDRSKRGNKTQVNVVIAGHGQQPPMGAGAPPMPPVNPGMPMPPRPPMAGPMMGAPPPGVGMPPGMMGRKRGGATYDAGAATGEGRLEKVEHYGRKFAKGKAK